jgi:hypothetical protein
MSEHAQCAHLSRAPRHDQGVRAIAIFIAFEELWQVECDDRSQRPDAGKLPRTCIFWFKATTLSLGGEGRRLADGRHTSLHVAASCGVFLCPCILQLVAAVPFRACTNAFQASVLLRVGGGQQCWVALRRGHACRALTAVGPKVAAASPASKLFVDVLADMPWESAGKRRSGALGLHRLDSPRAPASWVPGQRYWRLLPTPRLRPTTRGERPRPPPIHVDVTNRPGRFRRFRRRR